MKKILCFILAVLMMSPGYVTAASTVNVDFSGMYDYDFAYEVLELVNIERKKEGLSPVVMDESLLDTAMQRAAECNIYFSHTRPDGSDCFDAFDDSFYYGKKGENIAIAQDDAKEVMESWMNSPGHKANILNPEFKSMGVGCFHQTQYSCRSWVQVFHSNSRSEYKTSGTKSVTVRIPVSLENVSLIPYTPSISSLDDGRVNSVNALCPGETRDYGLAFRNKEFEYCITFLNDSCFTVEHDEYFSRNGNKFTALEEGKGSIEFGLDGKYTLTYYITIEHVYRYKYNVAPTCTEKGYTAGICYYCEYDGPIEGTYVDALGHTEFAVSGYAPTCDSPGLTDGLKCSVCGEFTVPQETINSKGHAYVVQKAVPVGCTKDGLTEGKYCSDCNEVFSVQTVIPATGHKWDNGKLNSAGEYVFTCLNCSEKLVSRAKEIDSDIGEVYKSFSVADKNEVEKLKKEYDALSEEEKKLVKNADQLILMAEKIEFYHKGDIDLSGTINSTDLSKLLSAYGTSDSVCDINDSGVVNSSDLSDLLSYYGSARQ